MKYELELDDETKKLLQQIAQPRTPLDLRKLSDEELDEFILKNSRTIYIIAATDERRRRDDATADEAEKARYQSANRQSLFAIAVAVISLALAIIAWWYPREPQASNPHPPTAHQSLTNTPSRY